MPSPFFQSYVAVLQRLGQIEAECAPRPAPPVDPAHLVTSGEPIHPEAMPMPASYEPLPGEEPPLRLSDLPLGQRFRGN